MTVRHVGGLDLSSTRCGYAAPNGTTHSFSPFAGASDPARRLDEIGNGLVRLIRLNPPIPDYMVIENYVLGAKLQRSSVLITLAEVGGVVRRELFLLDIPYASPVPTNLKRFATGKGNATKEEMVKAAEALTAHRIANDDEADAFHARRMGRIVHGLEPHLHDYELDAIDTSGVAW